jgi:hypothetical protein
MALETGIYFIGAPQGERRADLKSQSGLRMGGDSMKPKNCLERSYTAVFLSREDWIRGPKALRTSKNFSGLQTALGQSGGLRLGRVGLK